MWELEAIAKANTSEETRKRVSEEDMEEVRKKVRCVFEESVIRKEDVSGLIEEIERVCYCVCFVKLCMGVLRVDNSVQCSGVVFSSIVFNSTTLNSNTHTQQHTFKSHGRFLFIVNTMVSHHNTE